MLLALESCQNIFLARIFFQRTVQFPAALRQAQCGKGKFISFLIKHTHEKQRKHKEQIQLLFFWLFSEVL